MLAPESSDEWLNVSPNGSSDHELKLMNADGGASEMLLVDHDVWDIGIGCGGASDVIFTDGFESGDTSEWSTGTNHR